MESKGTPLWVKILIGFVLPIILALIAQLSGLLPLIINKISPPEPPPIEERQPDPEPEPEFLPGTNAPGDEASGTNAPPDLHIEDREHGINIEQRCPDGVVCGGWELDSDGDRLYFRKERPRPMAAEGRPDKKSPSRPKHPPDSDGE